VFDLVRLAAFALILAGVVDKTCGRPAGVR
jgi:hypothetical protein